MLLRFLQPSGCGYVVKFGRTHAEGASPQIFLLWKGPKGGGGEGGGGAAASACGSLVAGFRQ